MLIMTREELMLEVAWRLYGTPYIYGGNSPLVGLDCSGFVCEVLRSVGIIGKEDLNAQMLYDRFKLLPNSIKPGSLLFFGKDLKSISHVGLAVSDFAYLEAGGGDSTTYSVEKAQKQNAYVRLRPISLRMDLLAIRNVI